MSIKKRQAILKRFIDLKFGIFFLFIYFFLLMITLNNYIYNTTKNQTRTGLKEIIKKYNGAMK